MTGVTAIRVDHDLATCETGVSDRAADDKPSCRVDEGAQPSLSQLLRNHRIDHVLGDVRSKLLGFDLLVVLR